MSCFAIRSLLFGAGLALCVSETPAAAQEQLRYPQIIHYRYEATDASHEHTFHQVEGLWIDRNVTLADLRGVLDFFVKETFGADAEIRLRPSFFPFTEPSFEMDLRSPNLGRLSDRWLEIMGCGLVDPKVLELCGLDPQEWSGLAFGLGLERIAMLVHGIDDIRHFYNNDTRFLRQFA